jgi:hypothetical protein
MPTPPPPQNVMRIAEDGGPTQCMEAVYRAAAFNNKRVNFVITLCAARLAAPLPAFTCRRRAAQPPSACCCCRPPRASARAPCRTQPDLRALALRRYFKDTDGDTIPNFYCYRCEGGGGGCHKLPAKAWRS